MKTSDKLLLTLALMILGVFGAVHLTLYARMKAGHIVNVHSQSGWRLLYEGKAPHLVVLEGDINVQLTLSDSFFIEMQEEARGQVSCRPAGIDSMVVKGDSTQSINPHSPVQYYNDRPWVNIHAPSPTDIRLKGVQALLQGSKQPGKRNLHVQAISSQLLLGGYGATGPDFFNQYYDAVQVQAENSKLVLNQNAVIHKLSVRLDDVSEMNDQKATIDSIYIQHMAHSKINLTGTNLDKLIKTGQ